MVRQALLATMMILGCAGRGFSQGAAQPKAAQSAAAQPGGARQHPDGAQNVGEQKFRQNCSRCHEAPDALPSSIAGTVTMHMRMRANLSAADQRAILHYLAP